MKTPASLLSPGTLLSSSSLYGVWLNILPELHRDRDQWVSYDNGKTLKKKMDYANGKCLGGVMVKSLRLSLFSELIFISDLGCIHG